MSTATDPRPADAGTDRLRRLARLADRLSDALSVRQAADAVAMAGAQELQADSVSVCLLSDDGSCYDLAASDGLRADMVQQWASFPADAPVPVVDAVRDRVMVVIQGTEERERRYPVFGRGPLTSETLVIAPMVVHDDIVIGALAVGFAARRELSEVDLAFIQAAAELCGQAVHRARLVELRRRDLVRQSLGARVTDLLAAEQDFDRTLHEVARLAVDELADVCALCLVDEDGVLRPAAALHHDPAGQQVLDQLVARQPVIRSPQVLEVARTGKAMLIATGEAGMRENSAEDEAHRQLLQALDATSAIIVPMVARGTVVGTLVLAMTAGSRTVDEEDLRVAEQLASWSALALDNARLYAEQVELVGHLERALQSHKAIEQAKGVLVHRWDVTPSEAFARLRQHARSTRRKIEEVAEDVVAGRDDLPEPELVR